MQVHPDKHRQWAQSAILFVFITISFALAYTQSPLYTSNQNQYFLHGLAQAGYGELERDWLANTLDPTPVFSLLVHITYQLTQFEGLFYLYYAILLGIYAWCMLGIVDQLYNLWRSRALLLAFLALLILAHSAALRFFISRTLGINWTYILEDGVADQRLLGPVLQPSAFGVLLVVSIYLYMKKHPYLAVISAALAATLHPTYLMSAAALTLAYMILIYREKRRVLPALLVGGTALLCVLPILIYVYINFGSSPPETSALAQQILVDFRIPHHARVVEWFDATAVIKIILVVVALYLVRHTRLLWILLIPSLIATILTLTQLLTKSNTLALLFPWRMSTFLVPISTTLILAYSLNWLAERYTLQLSQRETRLMRISLVLIALAVTVGVIRLVLDFERKANEDEQLIISYVAENLAPGDIYLTPVKMQDFRLESGAPVYVDFKSIPYRDSDVLVWRKRIELADQVYQNANCQVLVTIQQQAGITHVVIENDHIKLNCIGLEEIYQDPAYRVYRYYP